MSALDPRTPVLVGVGQVTNRGDDLVDPITLAAEATRQAIADCGADLPVDTIAMPGVLAPRTDHAAHRLAAALGLSPRRLLSSTIGGNTPQWLVGTLGTDIVEGRCDVALVAGAEAGASVRRARKQGITPRIAREAGGKDTEIGDTRMGASPAEMHAGLAPPPFLYPILESAVAHHAGRTLDEQRRFLGRFMAPATEVAAAHPDLAWFPEPATPDELSEPTPGNRMIAEPYTKRMNAIIEVDQAAAFLLCSAAVAESAGIPRDRWVFPLGVADLNDVFHPLERPELHRSPAIETAGGALFQAVGCGLDDISRFDFYSCFPVAVEISATALGLRLDDPRPFTVTGGHAYFGGPGNNYTSHSIATMAQQLRDDPGAIGLTTGLGWYVTKHSIGLWSTTPPERGFAKPDLAAAQAAIDAKARPRPSPAPPVRRPWTAGRSSMTGTPARRPSWPSPPPPTDGGSSSAGTIRRWPLSSRAASWWARRSRSCRAARGRRASSWVDRRSGQPGPKGGTGPDQAVRPTFVTGPSVDLAQPGGRVRHSGSHVSQMASRTRQGDPVSEQVTMTIDGVAATTEAAFDVVNPATGAPEATAPDCTPQQLDAAMDSAAKAYRDWRRDEGRRRELLRQCADALMAAAEDVAPILTLEQGKPLGEATFEVYGAAIWFQYYADLEIPRQVIQDDDAAFVEVVQRPLGVVAGITPWNFPLVLASWKIAPALLAGNTMVLKPSPFTPRATLKVGEILRDVLPPGVLNVISGKDPLGASMTSHPVPRKISFTGSVATGKKVAAAAAPDLKRTTLELGGNDPAIVLDDVDVDVVVEKLFWGAFQNNGQVCSAIKRVYVPEALHDRIVDGLADRARSVKVGAGTEADVQLGPINNRPQYERVSELVSDALASGGVAAAGGKPMEGDGYFFEPTILTGLSDGSRIVDEEQFGPALPVITYRDVDEVVERANATHYGLSGSVWGADVERATQIAENLECGTAWVNTHLALAPHQPFGGAKWSGIGVENGTWGLLGFSEPQVVHRSKA